MERRGLLAHSTKNDLPESVRSSIVDLCNALLADAIDLELEAKQAHWNVKGPHFIALHELFDTVAEEVEGHVDLLAERAVQLGGIAVGTVQGVAVRSRLPEYPLSIAVGDEHLRALASALAMFGANVRHAINRAGALEDADSMDIFTEISRATDKQLWLLEAHTQGAAKTARSAAMAPHARTAESRELQPHGQRD